MYKASCKERLLPGGLQLSPHLNNNRYNNDLLRDVFNRISVQYFKEAVSITWLICPPDNFFRFLLAVLDVARVCLWAYACV